MANDERLRNTVGCINAIMCEASSNCLRPIIPYPTLVLSSSVPVPVSVPAGFSKVHLPSIEREKVYVTYSYHPFFISGDCSRACRDRKRTLKRFGGRGLVRVRLGRKHAGGRRDKKHCSPCGQYQSNPNEAESVYLLYFIAFITHRALMPMYNNIIPLAHACRVIV